MKKIDLKNTGKEREVMNNSLLFVDIKCNVLPEAMKCQSNWAEASDLGQLWELHANEQVVQCTGRGLQSCAEWIRLCSGPYFVHELCSCCGLLDTKIESLSLQKQIEYNPATTLLL